MQDMITLLSKISLFSGLERERVRMDLLKTRENLF